MKSYYGEAQQGIKGPGCIIPGTTYQYMISGQWGSSSNPQLCITGGFLASGDSCISLGTKPSMVLLIWNDSVSERKIQISSDLGTISMEINGTHELNGGIINDTDKVQILNPDQSLYTFHCAAPTGGSCIPNYTYQWQSSSNQLDWTNIQGANGKDLEYPGTITVSTYFRRVTIETNSNILAYSDSGQLLITYKSKKKNA